MALGGGLESAHFGARLRALREARGLSIRQLADRIALSPSRLSAIERDAEPRLRTITLLRIQRALGLTSVEALFGNTPSAGWADALSQGP